MLFDNDISCKLYHQLSELEEKLLKSETERKILEAKFQQLAETYKIQEDRRLEHLREKYTEFLQNCQERSRRNDDILKSLQKVENGANAVFAKTERLKQLRTHYDAYLSRALPLWRHPNVLDLQGTFPDLSGWSSNQLSPSVRPAMLLPGGGAVMLPVDEMGRNISAGSLYQPHISEPQHLPQRPDNVHTNKVISTLGEAGRRMMHELSIIEGTNKPLAVDRPFYYQTYHLPVYIPPTMAPPIYLGPSGLPSMPAYKEQPTKKETSPTIRDFTPASKPETKPSKEETSKEFEIECLPTDAIDDEGSNLSDDEVLGVTIESGPKKEPEVKVSPVMQKVAVTHQKSIEELKAMLSFEEDDENKDAAYEQSDSQYLIDEDVPEDFNEQNFPESHYDPRYQRDVSRNVILEEDEEEEEEKMMLNQRQFANGHRYPTETYNQHPSPQLPPEVARKQQIETYQPEKYNREQSYKEEDSLNQRAKRETQQQDSAFSPNTQYNAQTYEDTHTRNYESSTQKIEQQNIYQRAVEESKPTYYPESPVQQQRADLSRQNSNGRTPIAEAYQSPNKVGNLRNDLAGPSLQRSPQHYAEKFNAITQRVVSSKKKEAEATPQLRQVVNTVLEERNKNGEGIKERVSNEVEESRNVSKAPKVPVEAQEIQLLEESPAEQYGYDYQQDEDYLPEGQVGAIIREEAQQRSPNSYPDDAYRQTEEYGPTEQYQEQPYGEFQDQNEPYQPYGDDAHSQQYLYDSQDPNYVYQEGNNEQYQGDGNNMPEYQTGYQYQEEFDPNTQQYQQPNEPYPEQSELYQQPNESYPQQNEQYQQPTELYPQQDEQYQHSNESYPQQDDQYQHPEMQYQQPDPQYLPPENRYQPPDQQYAGEDYGELREVYEDEVPIKNERVQENASPQQARVAAEQQPPKSAVLAQLMDSESESYKMEPAGSAHEDSDFDFSLGK